MEDEYFGCENQTNHRGYIAGDHIGVVCSELDVGCCDACWLAVIHHVVGQHLFYLPERNR